MTNMQDFSHLRALAEAAAVVDHNENANWYDSGSLLGYGLHYPKNTRFIEVANPATVITLLDALEAAQAGNARLKESFIGMTVLAKEAADERDQALARLAALEQQEPVFYGFLREQDCRVELCHSPSAPNTSGEYAKPYYAAAGASPQPSQAPQGCACRWDADDNRIATCTRHQGWLDVVGEWADRAKAAESKLAQPTDDASAYAKNIAIYLWKKFYKKEAPTFEVCNGLYDVLSQIDNMVTGLPVRPPHTPKVGDLRTDVVNPMAAWPWQTQESINALTDTTPSQAGELSDEHERALCEAQCNQYADEYFKARPQIDSDVNRRIFYAGHRKCWIACMSAMGTPATNAKCNVSTMHSKPIDMVLFCPKCCTQHIDGPEQSVEHDHGAMEFPAWDNPPHRSHLCKNCGHIWRPADVATNGVLFVQTKGKDDKPLKQPLDYVKTAAKEGHAWGIDAARPRAPDGWPASQIIDVMDPEYLDAILSNALAGGSS